MPNVCHFLRKSSQLRSSFINNQISFHQRYIPSIIHRLHTKEINAGGYADFKRDVDILDLNKYETKFEKLLYRYPKILSAKQIQRIKQFIINKNIQVLHFHYGTDCGVFHPLLRNIKIPSVVSFYGYDCSSFPSYLLGYGKKYLQHRVFNHVSAVLAMSPDMKKDLLNAGCPEHKIIVHYYGTDCTKFYKQHDYSVKKTVTILTISNLCDKKGHLFQFKGLERVIKSGICNFQMRVVGTGETEDKLKHYVEKNGLSDYIKFLGAVKYGSKEMLEVYRKADIFLHPSVIAPNGDKEGIPGTIIEAMASGLPVISTYHAGIPYIIENNKTGLLIKEWDVDALSDAIISLLKDKNLRQTLGIAAQEYALNNLDLKIKEIELEKIYDGLLNK